MASLNQNDILFTLNGNVVTPFEGKYTNSSNYDAETGLYTQNQSKLNAKSFNAVEIDWNGAELDSNTTINTTGELLSEIKETYSLMFAN